MVERFGMIDEASGHAPLYFGRTTDLPPHAVHGEQYVRHSDYAVLEARMRELEEALRPFANLAEASDRFAVEALRSLHGSDADGLSDTDLAHIAEPNETIKVTDGALAFGRSGPRPQKTVVTMGDFRRARTALQKGAGK